MPVQHTLKQGECIFSIANRYGHKWESIWDAPENKALRETREHPGVLLAGDVISVPDPSAKRMSLASRQRHVVQVVRNLVTVRVRVLKTPPPPSGDPASVQASRDQTSLTVEDPEPTEAANDEPRANAPWELWVGEELVTSGQSDGDGNIEFRLPPEIERADLIVDPGAADKLRVALALGGLDPISTVSGVKQRLYNLGFDCGDTNQEVHDNFAALLAAFQSAQGLDATGELDDQTRDQLADLHGL